MDVTISEGGMDNLMGIEKKKKQDVEMTDNCAQNDKVVLKDQHHHPL